MSADATGAGEAAGVANHLVGVGSSVVADEEQTAVDSMVRGARVPTPDSAAGKAVEAGGIAARAVWSQAPSLIPLLAALSYGLGRLMVDAFYARLHTSAEAAGLSYGSILEPAAIMTAVLASVGTAIAMVSDAILAVGRWLFENRRVVELALLALVGVGGGLALVFIQIFRVDEMIAFISGVSVPAFRTLLDKFGSVRDRRVGKARASAETSLSGPDSSDGSFGRVETKRVAVVMLSVAFLMSLLFGAHELGIREGERAADGKPVDMSFLGFNVPSITAIVVRVQPIVSSPAFAQLARGRCWLEIGTGGASVLLYDPADKSILAIPSDQIVVTTAGTSCAADTRAG